MRTLTADETARTLAERRLDSPQGLGFAFHDRAQDIAYHWHAHDYHQLLYALSGTAQLEAAGARFLLPPQRAAWIPAGLQHRTLLSSVDGASVYLAPALLPSPLQSLPGGVRILAATPLMREMMIHALRWPVGGNVGALADSFFTTLGMLCGEWLAAELRLSLPTSAHPAVLRAIDYALADLAAADQAGAAAAAHVSDRTFRRLFGAEVGLGWKPWLTQARLLAAMTLLDQGGRVTDVAAEVGFASLSAFAKAFAALTGQSPSAYRLGLRR